MFSRWRAVPAEQGVIVIPAAGAVDGQSGVVALEFNEFLGRIASGAIGEQDQVISRIVTDGVRKRAGDLRLFEMVRSGRVTTDDLPRREADGILAAGLDALHILHAIERPGTQPDAATLLRPVPFPAFAYLFARELLRAAMHAAYEPHDEMLHPAQNPPAAEADDPDALQL